MASGFADFTILPGKPLKWWGARAIGCIVYARRRDFFEADIRGQQGVVVRNDAGHAAIF